MRVANLAGDKFHRPLRGLRSGAPDRGREALDLPASGQDERFWRRCHRCQGVRRRQGRRRWGGRLWHSLNRNITSFMLRKYG